MGTVSDLALHFLLHLKRLGDIQSFLDRWSSVDAIQPCLEVFEFVHINPCPFSPIDPGKRSKIGDGHLITDSPWST